MDCISGTKKFIALIFILLTLIYFILVIQYSTIKVGTWCGSEELRVLFPEDGRNCSALRKF